MRFSYRVRLAALLAAGSTLAACRGDSGTGPSDVGPSVSLTQALMDMSRPEVGVLGSMAVLAPIPSLPVISPSGCSYAPSTQRFECGAITVSGLTLTRSYALLAADGTTQSRFDPATTDGVRTQSRATGTITSPGSVFTIDDRRELVMTGLRAPIRLLNGSAVTRIDGTVTGAGTPIPLSNTITTTIANLAIPAGSGYPSGGTITVDVAEQVASFPAHTTHIVATFNGTSTLAVTVSGGPAIVRCTLDLSGAKPSSCAP